MQHDFVDVTEIADEPISGEQLERLINRYCWAARYCRGKDVVEAACGIGPGLGLLHSVARSLEAGDFSARILDIGHQHYGDRVELTRFDAQRMPFADSSKDVIILFEAIYYLRRPELFLAECARVLRMDGRVLIASANKDLWGFHPSPFSHCYFGVAEMGKVLDEHGFTAEFFGFQAIDAAPIRQRLLRPVKRLAVMSGLLPKTMSGKRWLKRVVFGKEFRMPRELEHDCASYLPPAPIPYGVADRRHKIIYCSAVRTPEIA